MAKAKRPQQDQTLGEVQKPKRSLFDQFINAVCILILIGLLYSEYGHLRKPEAPMAEYTALYEKHYDVSLRPPFVIAWYLLVPDNYDPQYKYPLVLALHGISNFIYAGIFLASPEMRAKFPAFVVVPIASKRTVWAMPDNKSYALQRKGLRFPDALPRSVAVIKKLQKQYSIDSERIYVTGHSVGGIGTFGALAHYPDLFAAGLVSAGLWDPIEAPSFLQKPLLVFHGSADQQIPANVTRSLVSNVKELGGNVEYFEFPGAGHGIWKDVYSSPAGWEWLFSQ